MKRTKLILGYAYTCSWIICCLLCTTFWSRVINDENTNDGSYRLKQMELGKSAKFSPNDFDSVQILRKPHISKLYAWKDKEGSSLKAKYNPLFCLHNVKWRCRYWNMMRSDNSSQMKISFSALQRSTAFPKFVSIIQFYLTRWLQIP